MARQKKPKITITEIKKNIKVTEIKKEKEEAVQGENESLEDLASSAPSSREFPQVNQQIRPQPEQASGETIQENKTPSQNQPVYGVHNITEGELQRTYETRIVGGAQTALTKNPSLLVQRERAGSELQNSEVQALRAKAQGEERDKYDVLIEPQQERRRKLPWEL